MNVFSTILNGFYGQLGALIVTGIYLPALLLVRRLRATLRAPAIRVYLSSSLLDLPHHREAVASGVRKAGGRLLGDPPDVHRPHLVLEERRDEITAADLFIGLYAWQYGPVCAETGRSWTEEEFDLAKSRDDLPMRCWIVRENAAWPRNLMDEDTRAGSSPIGRLRAKVEPEAEALSDRPAALAGKVYRTVVARQRELHPHARLRAELMSYRTLVMTGVVAVVGAVYAALRIPGEPVDQLPAVLGVATATAVMCYAARIAATQLIWDD